MYQYSTKLQGSACALMIALAGLASAQPDIYVDADATGADDGSSWTDAYTDFDDALSAAATGDVIWVAEGTYRPGTSSTGFVVSDKSLSIYGGFDGTETSLSGRAELFTTTILTADAGTPSDDTDNGERVMNVSAPNPGRTLVLDGFVIRDARRTTGSGGGLKLANYQADILNCRFINNHAPSGGGLSVSTGSADVSECLFNDNEATSTNGGGANLFDGKVYNCIFKNNTAAGRGGGLVYEAVNANQGGAGVSVVANCTFYKNEADDGAGMSTGLNCLIGCTSYRVLITSCTFASNVATGDGGGIELTSGPGGTPWIISNSIFWKNSATTNNQISGSAHLVTDCTVEGGYASGTSISTSDPRFQDIGTGDLRLYPASPARDLGSNTEMTGDPNDLDGDSNTSEVAVNDAFDIDDDSNSTEYLPLSLQANNEERTRIIDDIDHGAIESCPADSNRDGVLSSTDFNAWIAAYNNNNLDIADINRDGVLTTADQTAWTAAYDSGNGCD